SSDLGGGGRRGGGGGGWGGGGGGGRGGGAWEGGWGGGRVGRGRQGSGGRGVGPGRRGSGGRGGGRGGKMHSAEPDRHIATLRSYRVHFSHLPRVGTGARAPVGVGWPGRGRVARARPRPPVCRVSPGVPGRSRCAGSVAVNRGVPGQSRRARSVPVSPGVPGQPRSVAGQAVTQSEPSEPGEHREGDGRGEGCRVGTGAGEVPAHGVVAARTTVARGT